MSTHPAQPRTRRSASTPTPTSACGQKRSREPSTVEKQPTKDQGDGSGSESCEPEEPPHFKELKKATAAQVWCYKLRKYARWYLETRGTPETHLCWIPMQWSFLRAMTHSRNRLFSHRVIDVDTLARPASMIVEEMRSYLNYLLGLLEILTLSGHQHREWVLQFYATVWIDCQHRLNICSIETGTRSTCELLVTCLELE